VFFSHPQCPSGLNVVTQGLGTSTNDDAKEYFSHMGAHMIPFAKLRDEERPSIDLAFSKKKG
jgi:DNA topoisomerase II